MYSTLPSASALARTARWALSGLAFTTWAVCHTGSAASCSAAASAPRKFGIFPTTVPGGFAAPSRSSSAQMRLRTSCLARSISMRACSDWTFSGPHLPGSRHQREQPLVQVLRKRLVAPWAELTDRRERHVQPAPTTGYLQQVDRSVEHCACLVNHALADVREGQVPENDRLRLVTTLQSVRGALQDRPRLCTVAKSEIAGASDPSEPVIGEEAVGRIGGLHGLQVCLGRAEGSLALFPLAQHRVALADMQERQTWQGMAGAIAGERSRLLRQLEPCPRILLAIQGDVALAKACVRLRCRVAGLVRGSNRLVVVADGGRVVASLRCIPDELAHERRQLRLNELEFMADPTVRSVPPKERDLAGALSGRGKQRGRGGKVVLLGKGVRPHAEISYG